MDQPNEGSSMNIYQRINEVRKKVAYLQKKKKVDGGGYLAVTHDQVTGEVREFLIEFGVIVEPPHVVSSSVLDTGTKTAKGIPFIRYEAVYRVDFVNMDKPEDRITREIGVHAIDQGDKAPGKAMSYATKYAMLKLFSLETGEEDEERPFQKPSKNETARALQGSNVKPNAGAGEDLTPEERKRTEEVASRVIDWFDSGSDEDAFAEYDNSGLSNDEKRFLWTFLDAKQRRRITEIGKAKRMKTEEATQA